MQVETVGLYHKLAAITDAKVHQGTFSMVHCVSLILDEKDTYCEMCAFAVESLQNS